MPAITLKQLAAEIEREFPNMVAIVYPANHPMGGFCNTDRKVGRFRHPGKGRRGSRLIVSFRPGSRPDTCPSNGGAHDYTSIGPYCRNCGEHRLGIVFEHNAAETYRTNNDVVRWIRNRREGREQ